MKNFFKERVTYEFEESFYQNGGTETGHGGQTPFERMTWLACNKPVEITDENKTYALTK